MGLPPWMIPPERLGPEMRRVYQEGVRAVKDGAKILIRGEDGVGKKVMARWLHEASPRADPILRRCARLPWARSWRDPR